MSSASSQPSEPMGPCGSLSEHMCAHRLLLETIWRSTWIPSLFPSSLKDEPGFDPLCDLGTCKGNVLGLLILGPSGDSGRTGQMTEA